MTGHESKGKTTETSADESEPPAEPGKEAQDKEPTDLGPAFMPEPAAVNAQVKDALPKVSKGKRLVVYTGNANVLRHGEYVFRVGKPVIVPSEVAEELLTLPFESFEAIEE